MFYPIENPRKNMVAGRSAHFLKENPLVRAGCGVNFTPACAQWKKIGDAKFSENASYKFLFNA